MFLKPGNRKRCVWLICSWVILWLLAIPLYHVHALDVQENAQRSGSFLAHTVFSGGLPGEYSAAPYGGHRTGDDQRLEIHYPHYSEIDFVVAEQDGKKSAVGTEPKSLGLLSPQQISLLLFSQTSWPIELITTPFRLYTRLAPSRAPPDSF